MIDYTAHLCVYDSRSDVFNHDEELPEARDHCACDRCFYGRDTLAVEGLALAARLAEAERLLLAWGDWYCGKPNRIGLPMDETGKFLRAADSAEPRESAV